MPQTMIHKGKLTAALFFVLLLGAMSWVQVSPVAASGFTISNPAISQLWQSYGGASSFLGLPTTNTLTCAPDQSFSGAQYNNFQNNSFGSTAIFSSSITGTHTSWGPIRQLWLLENAQGSNVTSDCSDNNLSSRAIGFPTSEWTYFGTYSGWGQIWYQNYQSPNYTATGTHYSIFWASNPSPSTAAHLSNGAWCTFYDGKTYQLCAGGG